MFFKCYSLGKKECQVDHWISDSLRDKTGSRKKQCNCKTRGNFGSNLRRFIMTIDHNFIRSAFSESLVRPVGSDLSNLCVIHVYLWGDRPWVCVTWTVLFIAVSPDSAIQWDDLRNGRTMKHQNFPQVTTSDFPFSGPDGWIEIFSPIN